VAALFLQGGKSLSLVFVRKGVICRLAGQIKNFENCQEIVYGRAIYEIPPSPLS
jgi:hypothetical protein